MASAEGAVTSGPTRPAKRVSAARGAVAFHRDAGIELLAGAIHSSAKYYCDTEADVFTRVEKCPPEARLSRGLDSAS